MQRVARSVVSSSSLRWQAVRGAATGTPSFTGEVYSQSEKARENLWMSREDEKSLRKLLNKVKGQADTHAPSTAEAEALQKIVGSYKMKPADIAALVNWRHSHDF